MKQIIHMFKKDVRRHWPEIALSLIVLALYVWNEPSRWLPQELRASRQRDNLTAVLNVAVVLSWCVLVIRVVQGESLVGDRQFWITRPYDWKKLLAAKLLFILAFISFPSLIAGAILFVEGGFGSPWPFLAAILTIQSGTITSIVLIGMALAAVTASITQFLLALIAVAAYVAAAALIATYVPSQEFSSGSDTLQQGILLVGCLAAILWQYARRGTVASRMLLAGSALAIFVVVIATPYQRLVAREYGLPRAGSQSLQLVFDDVKPPPPEVAASDEKEVEIKIPLRVGGIAPATSVNVDGAMLNLQTADGSHWNSGWNRVGQHLYPEDRSFQPSFHVKRKFFESVKAAPVQAHITFAVSTFYNGETRRILARSGEFPVPGVGFCSIVPRYLSDSLLCRFAIRSPTFLTTIASTETTCPAGPEGPPPSGLISRDWSGATDADLVSPVETLNIYFWKWDGDVDSKTSPTICPGTALIFRTQEAGPQIRSEIEINDIKLEDYQVTNVIRFSVSR